MNPVFYAVGVICSATIPLGDFGQCGPLLVNGSPFETLAACESAQQTALEKFWSDPENPFKPGKELIYLKAGCLAERPGFDPASTGGTKLIFKMFGPSDGREHKS
jgi:hypothetical protein